MKATIVYPWGNTGWEASFEATGPPLLLHFILEIRSSERPIPAILSWNKLQAALKKHNFPQSPMKHGDLEFHKLTSPILDAIAKEGLRIARENNWRGLVIEVAATARGAGGTSRVVRCCLRNTEGEPEIDEPSGALLDEVNRLQDLFTRVGTPLSGATIDWIDESGDGRLRRRCRYRYD